MKRAINNIMINQSSHKIQPNFFICQNESIFVSTNVYVEYNIEIDESMSKDLVS